MNRKYKVRDTIVFGGYEPKEYIGGIRNFNDLDVDRLQQLLEQKFIKPHERQNYCPSTLQMLEFMKQYPGYVANGYVVSIERKDYRITLTGLSKDKPASSEQEITDFNQLFGDADELKVGDKMFCWFD